MCKYLHEKKKIQFFFLQHLSKQFSEWYLEKGSYQNKLTSCHPIVHPRKKKHKLESLKWMLTKIILTSNGLTVNLRKQRIQLASLNTDSVLQSVKCWLSWAKGEFSQPVWTQNQSFSLLNAGHSSPGLTAWGVQLNSHSNRIHCEILSPHARNAFLGRVLELQNHKVIPWSPRIISVTLCCYF